LKLAGLQAPEESLWVLGEEGVIKYEQLQAPDHAPGSQSFLNAGIYILRDRDLYLLFNASDAGINGRGSHGHNDALSIEVSACGRSFIIDPGTYVYTADLDERHRFRSTIYHSTVQIDGIEQNTTDERAPFFIDDEAHPKLLAWETASERDLVSAEHDGYARLREPVRHRRTVTFNKSERVWLVEDEFTGSGEHKFGTRFHFDTGLEVRVLDEKTTSAYDKTTGAKLLVSSLDFQQPPTLEDKFISRDYGSKQPSISACWSVTHCVPFKLRWAILPVCPGEDETMRLAVMRPTEN
jgi:uncharacterized heparinase superfamily protein